LRGWPEPLPDEEVLEDSPGRTRRPAGGTREVRKAQEAGDLDASVEAEQIAFELDALGAAAHQQPVGPSNRLSERCPPSRRGLNKGPYLPSIVR
jgi:hypothetical protein